MANFVKSCDCTVPGLFTIQPQLDREKLHALCKEFIKANKIDCPEAIYQCDGVIENAYELIENIANIVGYHKED